MLQWFFTSSVKNKEEKGKFQLLWKNNLSSPSVVRVSKLKICLIFFSSNELSKCRQIRWNPSSFLFVFVLFCFVSLFATSNCFTLYLQISCCSSVLTVTLCYCAQNLMLLEVLLWNSNPLILRGYTQIYR